MELVSQNTNEITPASIDPMGMMIEPTYSYDVVVMKKKESGRVKIDNVPPEEFLISKRDKNIKDARFVAHRVNITRSDLIAAGYSKDVVDDLPAYSDLTFTPERIARYDRGEMPDEAQSLDFSMQEIEVYECYIRTDYDDDGIAELRKITYAGSEILDNEEVDHIPFSSHMSEIEKELDYSRNWHYSWSKIYFNRKYNRKLYAIIEGIKQLIISFIKIIVYFFNKEKRNTYDAKFLGTLCSLFFVKSYYRPKVIKK
jgi:hypothetical protein